MIDKGKLSSRYSVRRLDESDIDLILALCRGNMQFYRYCEHQPEEDQILNDMKLTPPGTDRADKYYIGFFHENDLVAVMDLIDGYPDPETAYIGFFMVNRKFQGRNTGTQIIRETEEYLANAGKRKIRLAIDKGNPQSTHFWKKNGFSVIGEKDLNGWTKLVAEKNI